MKLEDIYRKLDLIGKGGFVTLSNQEWKQGVQLPDRVLRLVCDHESPLSWLSAFFSFDGKPLIFFFENPSDSKALHKAIWNLNEVPVVVIGHNDTVDVYNGFAYKKELGSLERLGDESTLDNFSYFNIVTGKGWEEYKKELAHENRVDYFLLDNIQYAQEKILKTSVSRNLANRLIGKMIFLRYLTDRNVMLSFEGATRTLSNEDLIELLQNKKRLANLFDTLQDKDTGFNGDLFRITREELASVPVEALDVLVRLLRCDDLQCDSYSLFDVYDFSILPVEFISNVYERFIGKENQEKKGAYYTPLFLVDYIVENTVNKHLKASETSSCKILDPACGSGIFLVQSLRRIIDHYISHTNKEERTGETFQKKLKELVLDNIYGIDSDESAIQVAAFSIYLTLLDYQKPADISKFRFPKLLHTNLICRDAFCEKSFTGIDFDYIIGNPPWKRGLKEYDSDGTEIVPEYQNYIHRKELTEERDGIINNQEIAQAFVIRTFDYMSTTTHCALVLTSKVLYNQQSASFRKYWLDNAVIDSVLELSSVRREVFSQSSDPAIAPACVVFYHSKSKDGVQEDGLVKHTSLKPSVFFSLFKVLTVEKKDVQYVRQSLLYETDYLWKILQYGTYLDYLFIKRLKHFNRIIDVISTESFDYGQGIILGKPKKRKHDVSIYIGKHKVNAVDVSQYFVTPTENTWEQPKAQRCRRPEIFKAPLLLVKKSINATNYTARAAFFNTDSVYTDAITGIHSENVDELRNIAGVLNSDFFSYYALMCMSSIGIEREQSHNIEKFAIPYVAGDIHEHVKQIEGIIYKLYDNPLMPERPTLMSQKEKEQKAIEQCIVNELHLSEQEKALLDYAYSYSIPMATGKRHNEQLRKDRKGYDILTAYAEVFLKRFDGQFGKGTVLNYIYEIAPSHILLRFVVSSEVNEPAFNNGSIDTLEKFLLELSTECISENLYLRKDIRGFEKDGFYIIKPAEPRLWHPAIAYIDAQEFVDAILEQGIN